MATINWSLVCDYAFVADGKLSMIGLFEHIFAKQFPTLHPQLFLAINTTINLDDGPISLSAQVSAPGGNSISRIDKSPVMAVRDGVTLSNVFGFYRLPFEEPGEYHI